MSLRLHKLLIGWIKKHQATNSIPKSRISLVDVQNRARQFPVTFGTVLTLFSAEIHKL